MAAIRRVMMMEGLTDRLAGVLSTCKKLMTAKCFSVLYVRLVSRWKEDPGCTCIYDIDALDMAFFFFFNLFESKF